MRRWSASRHVSVIACGMLLFGGLRSPRAAHEVPMSYEQRVQLQEQATRRVVDSFNEVFNLHDVDTSAAL